MEPKKETVRIIGSAKINAYEVTFEKVSYTIVVKGCSRESSDRVDNIPDYEIAISIPFNKEYSFLYWMRNPAFTAMQESWSNNEDDCYFEHITDDRAALMTLNGSVVLIPVVNL
jgi:hypothetical protein